MAQRRKAELKPNQNSFVSKVKRTWSHLQEELIGSRHGFFGRLPVAEMDEGEVVDLLGPLDSTAADVAEELEQLVLGDGRRQIADEENLHLKQKSATDMKLLD